MQYEALPEKEVGAEAPGCSRGSSSDGVDFSELVRLHWAQVFRICLRITRNEHDAEDAAQDCFLRAFSHLHQFQGKAQFSTWLNSIARNCSLMLLRKRRSRQELKMGNSPESNGELLFIEPADSRPDQLSRVLYTESSDLLIRSISALPKTLRMVADLILFNELTLQEAGEILKISNASLKSRLFRARRRLSRFHGRRSNASVAHHNTFSGPGKSRNGPDSTCSKQESGARELSQIDLGPSYWSWTTHQSAHSASGADAVSRYE
jgi:RNA polymerase sigma factor (sigma-70 family)